MNPQAALRLQVQPADDGLAVTLHNTGPRLLRLWRRDTPWGQDMFSLHLGPAGAAPQRLHAAPQRFTRAVPRWDEIAPGATLSLRLARGDPHWLGWTAPADWLRQPLHVQLALHIEPTPEAAAHGIDCGRWLAEPVQSQPPHAWLTAPT